MSEPRLEAGESRLVVVGALIVAVPSLALLLVHEHDVAELVPSIGLVSYALVLGAAVLAYFHWRLVPQGAEDELQRRLAGWLAVGLTAGAVAGLLQMTTTSPAGALWSTLVQLGLTLLLCGCVAVAERVDVPAEPVVACGLTAVAVGAVYSLGLAVGPSKSPGPTTTALLSTCVVVSGLVLALVVLHRTKVSLWARRRLAAATVLMSLAQAARSAGDHEDAVLVAAVVALVLGALVLCVMTQQLLRRALLEKQAEFELLQRSLAEVRASVREDRELLHEVGATLAGITTASRVMRLRDAVPADRRRRIESMVTSELERLERLMLQRVDGGGSADSLIRVDDVVEPIVVSHQERGRQVSWSPSGDEAYAEPDELAELCNILLENAARHAPGAAVQLSVTALDGEVVVICADNGPGVPTHLRDHIFGAEVKGADSTGRGLGLAIAHRLATARGGSLELVDRGRPGATFAARLPRREVSDVPAGHVA